MKAGGREMLFLLEHTDVITAGRNADLGAWASEGYRVPAQPPPEDGEEGELPTAD